MNGKPILANFSRLKSVPVLVVLRSKTQNILLKIKVSDSETLLGGALSCRAPPHPTVERTASSASRKCVSFFGIPDLEGFSSCEKAYESVPCANKGLCPFETCKPLKRLDLNFLTSHSGRFFTHAGVLAVFKPRRGRLKIPVAPTGKLKLHVFPLRRAKENKHFGRFFEVRKVEYNRKKSCSWLI